MPITFRDKDRAHWESWLSKELGGRLETIRDRVSHLYEVHEESSPQSPHYTPHGAAHCRAVEDLLHHLIPGSKHEELSEDEKFFLLASAWLHDLGMICGILPGDDDRDAEQIREEHHVRSEKYLASSYSEVGVKEYEKSALGLLSLYHRRRCPLSACPELLPVPGHSDLRLRLLAAYLRLADALHVDQTRAPADQYAISLAYNIPSKAKLHWLRSKFVLGIDVDEKEREIAVHFRAPHPPRGSEPEDEEVDEAASQGLERFFDLVADDLASELDSVKDVLVAAGISYFIRVTRVVHHVAFEKSLWRDIRPVLRFHDLLHHPSSSGLSNLLLEGVRGVLESHKSPSGHGATSAPQPVIDAVGRFVEDVEREVVRSRPGHTGLRGLIRGIKEAASADPSALIRGIQKAASADQSALEVWVRFQQWKLREARRALRCSASQFVLHGLEGGRPDPDRPFDVLLYGYSELVVKALCGFRDAVLSRLSGEYQKCWEASLRPRVATLPWGDPEELFAAFNTAERQAISESKLFYEAQLERDASAAFRIFVCEGQPKNRTDWGGRIVYHDGVSYARSLAAHGFTNLFVVPDADAGTLIGPFQQCEGAPRVDLVMVGANGFDESTLTHSAGHTALVAQAKFAQRQGQERDGSDGLPRPAVVLAVTTDKYSSEGQPPSTGRRRPPETGFVEQDGWRFRRSFGAEAVAFNVFVSQDQALRDRLREEGWPFAFYNPRQDRYAISCVDVVVTEKAWLRRDWENPTEWTGKLIATKDQDSVKPAQGGPSRPASPKRGSPAAPESESEHDADGEARGTDGPSDAGRLSA